MVDQLDEQTIGIFEVKRAGAIAVGFDFFGKGNAENAQAVAPLVDIFGGADDKPEVIDVLHRAELAGICKSMNRKVIRAGSQVNVIGVGLPFDGHSHHFRVEIDRLLDIANVQRDVPDA